VADAFDDYFKEDDDGNPLPYLDGVDFEPIQEASTRMNAMLTGDAQFMSLVPADQVEQLEANNEVTVESRLGPNFGGLAFNVDAEPFTDKNVRLAVAKAIDKERYVQDVFFGRGQPDTGILPPPVEWAYRDEYGSDPDQKPPDQRFAPEEAQQLAEEAGVTDPDIELTVAQPELRGAKVIRSMLKEVLGWEVELNQQDFPTIFEQVPNGNFQAMPWGTSAAPDPDLAVYNQFGPPGAGNWWNYDEVLEEVNEQRTLLDNEERAEVLWEIEDQLIKDAPWAFLEHQDSIAARSNSLKGFTHLALIHRFRNVWLDE
jgi:peptide/nickel transport system substrate-binding protein